jgi:phage terminase Nu1 subunit (DNA packaging protein)
VATRTLTRAQAKAALGDMPERTFARWCSLGMPCKGDGRHARFPWPEIHHWFSQQMEKRGRDSARPANLEEARARKEAAAAELLEMEVAEKQGDLVSIGVHRQLVTDAFARVRAGLDAMPPRWAADFTTACSVAEAQLKLRKAVADVLGDLFRGEDVPDELETAAGGDESARD